MTTETLDQPMTDIVTREPRDTALMPGFTSGAAWELAQRVAKAFSASSLVPAQYQGNLPNCIVALEMANRMGASPLLVMQNLYLVHGNPGWSAKFLIASFNQCGRFSALRYEWNPERTACRALAVEKATGERIEGPMVTTQMAKDEGWSTKSGSKWKTMPELMLMYRAAAFLIRTYAPEISMGLQTAEELDDAPPPVQRPTMRADVVRKALGQLPPAAPEPALTLEYFRAAAEGATSAETAWLVADEARDHLGAEDLEALGNFIRQTWEA